MTDITLVENVRKAFEELILFTLLTDITEQLLQ